MRPSPRSHWVMLAYSYYYWWGYHPHIVDDFGNLVHLNSSKANLCLLADTEQ